MEDMLLETLDHCKDLREDILLFNQSLLLSWIKLDVIERGDLKEDSDCLARVLQATM